MNTQSFWQYSEKSKVAKAAGISRQLMNDYSLGSRSMSVKRARKMEAATLLVLGEGRVVPAVAWLGLEKHPAIGR